MNLFLGGMIDLYSLSHVGNDSNRSLLLSVQPFCIFWQSSQKKKKLVFDRSEGFNADKGRNIDLDAFLGDFEKVFCIIERVGTDEIVVTVNTLHDFGISSKRFGSCQKHLTSLIRSLRTIQYHSQDVWIKDIGKIFSCQFGSQKTHLTILYHIVHQECFE